MKGSIVLETSTFGSSPFHAATRAARRLVLRLTAKLRCGRLVVIDPLGRHEFGAVSSAFPQEVVLRVHDLSFYAQVALRGSLGAGESYVAGHWSATDLVTLVRMFLHDTDVAEQMDGRLAKLVQPLYRAAHSLRRNTKQGSRRNIGAHYDLGNDFYALFLDPTLSYSAAIFERPDTTLEEASIAKLERVCLKLDLKPNDHLLEIGTGWGALALHAASRFGCRVTTTTVSREQHALASRRVQDAGLGDRVQVLFSDYRDLQGRFDKIVSIEMIEAVGHEYYDLFFRRLSELLTPEGTALLQSITITDQRYETAKDAVDFIKCYVFPGSCIPSLTALLSHATRSSQLTLTHMEDITPHYARTLQLWRKRFLEAQGEVLALGHDQRFVRLWDFDLAYCEAGFRERYIGDVQLMLSNPRYRGAPPCPPRPPSRPRTSTETENASLAGSALPGPVARLRRQLGRRPFLASGSTGCGARVGRRRRSVCLLVWRTARRAGAERSRGRRAVLHRRRLGRGDVGSELVQRGDFGRASEVDVSAGSILVWAGAAVSVLMTLMFLVERRRRDASHVDVAWAGSIGGLAVLYAWAAPNGVRGAFVAALALARSLRLAGYLLFNRVLGKAEDGRYRALREEWGEPNGGKFFVVFQIQALLAFVFSLPLWVAVMNPAPAPRLWEWMALGVWAISILGETVADRQLASFRARPDARGKTCRVGLWRYSRHPTTSSSGWAGGLGWSAPSAVPGLA